MVPSIPTRIDNSCEILVGSRDKDVERAPNEIALCTRAAAGNIMSQRCIDYADGHADRIINRANYKYLCAPALGLRSINAGVAFL